MFTHTVRVPYAHTDQMGAVYYANYFVYFEMTRSEFLRDAGIPYTEMEKRGVMLPVVEAHCEYRKAARYDDLIEIRIRRASLRGPRLRLEYEVVRGIDLIATGYTDHVCVSPEGRVLRPVPEINALLTRDAGPGQSAE